MSTPVSNGHVHCEEHENQQADVSSSPSKVCDIPFARFYGAAVLIVHQLNLECDTRDDQGNYDSGPAQPSRSGSRTAATRAALSSHNSRQKRAHGGRALWLAVGSREKS